MWESEKYSLNVQSDRPRDYNLAKALFSSSVAPTSHTGGCKIWTLDHESIKSIAAIRRGNCVTMMQQKKKSFQHAYLHVNPITSCCIQRSRGPVRNGSVNKRGQRGQAVPYWWKKRLIHLWHSRKSAWRSITRWWISIELFLEKIVVNSRSSFN